MNIIVGPSICNGFDFRNRNDKPNISHIIDDIRSEVFDHAKTIDKTIIKSETIIYAINEILEFEEISGNITNIINQIYNDSEDNNINVELILGKISKVLKNNL